MKQFADQTFWTSFSKNFWEKKPFHVKNFQSSLNEIDQSEVFQMLISYSDNCRKMKSAEGFKLYIKGQMLHPEDVLQFLPIKKDKSLLGYHQRMEKDFSDYCLICDELLQVSQNNWLGLQKFSNDLFAYVGFPNRFIEIGLYLGNYRKTPFGVHVDGCGVFSFPVVGKKTFRLWTPNFGKKNPSLDRSLNYAKFNKASKTIKAAPGDMTYWPSSSWHIAESNGDFNATWSLGVWVDQPHYRNFTDSITALLQKKLSHSSEEKFELTPTENEIISLPKGYLNSISILKGLSAAELYDTLVIDWLKLVSKKGYRKNPKINFPSQLSLSTTIQIPKSEAIIWARLKAKKRTVYAFQGNVIETAPSAQLHNLITELNKGKPCLFSDYLKGSGKLERLKTFQLLFT